MSKGKESGSVINSLTHSYNQLLLERLHLGVILAKDLLRHRQSSLVHLLRLVKLPLLVQQRAIVKQHVHQLWRRRLEQAKRALKQWLGGRGLLAESGDLCKVV